jgi:hypothetical protein
MATLDSYPFLKAALEDIGLVSELTRRSLGTPRNIISLLHDALEFILYESLLAVDQDIYKNGQNTIGLDAAIQRCKENSIELPLLGTIRSIQKHRGDAKHHAQTPHETAFTKMVGEFRIIASRVIHERFAQALGAEIVGLGLLPYHVALYESYRKYRTHNWSLALQFALGAVLHKHRAVLAIPDNYRDGVVQARTAVLALLKHDIASAPYLQAPKDALVAWRTLPEDLAAMIGEGKVPEAAETAGHGYASVDSILPGVFDMMSARRLTDRLVQPQSLRIDRAMSWSKWQRGDTARKKDAEMRLAELLRRTPELVEAFGPPFQEDEDDRYWRWWVFAVFDDVRWHTFHLDDRFAMSLESGRFSDEDAAQRERLSEVILEEFGRAATYPESD